MSESHVIGELWEAARVGNLEQLQKCLSDGIAIDIQNRFSYTPLLYAAGAGQIHVVKWLLKHGAEVNYRSTQDYHTGGRICALHEAAAAGRGEVVQLLLQSGSRINLKDGFGRTALTHAVEQGNDSIVRQLITAGANVNIKGQDGWTALMAAVACNRLAIAKILAEYGANVHARCTTSGGSILSLAVLNPNTLSLDWINWILHCGVDVNIGERAGVTALMRSASAGNSEIVHKLLDSGASTTAKDEQGWTALFYAVVSRNPAVVRLLLERGADPLAVGKSPMEGMFPNDPKTWTPRDVAKRHPNPELIRLLEEATNR